MPHSKYQSSRLCGFGEEDFQRIFFRLRWQSEFFMEWNHLNNLYRAPSKEHLCKVWLLSHTWFWRRRCLSKLLTDDARRTTHDDGRQTQHDPKSSPWHYVPGELKIKQIFIYFSGVEIPCPTRPSVCPSVNTFMWHDYSNSSWYIVSSHGT